MVVVEVDGTVLASVDGTFRVGTGGGGGGAGRRKAVDDDDDDDDGIVVIVVDGIDEEVVDDNMEVALAVADANAEAEIAFDEANGCLDAMMGRLGIKGFVASSEVVGRGCELAEVGFETTFAAEAEEVARDFEFDDNRGRLEWIDVVVEVVNLDNGKR
jgi:hypothetical protein